MEKIITWLHISDIHFAASTNWRDNNSRKAFLKYLSALFESKKARKPDLIFCTGDIAFGELRSDPLHAQYESACSFFDELRAVCGESAPLALDRLFVVPGNHDIDRSKVNKHAQRAFASFADESHKVAHEINSQFDSRSTEFVDAVRRLSAYEQFVKSYLPHQYDESGRQQYALERDVSGIKVGIAGFNSAWTCAGDEDDRNLWLAAEWQFNAAQSKISNSDIKIGLIHHPSDWFVLCDRDIINTRVPSEYDFWLHGHSHNAWVSPGHTHVLIAAGAVGAETSAEFGVNLTTLKLNERTGTTFLHTMKAGANNWTVAPIANHAPTGAWEFPLPTRVIGMAHTKGYCQDQRETNKSVGTAETSPTSNIDVSDDGLVLRYFSRRLDESLRSFSTHPNKWVDRIISEASELSNDADLANKLDVSELVKNPISALIKAPAQYGLTCLAHYIMVEAWKQKSAQLFLYLDARALQPHKHSVSQAVSDELQMLGRKREEIKCVILDSNSDDKNTVKVLEIVNEMFPSIPLLVMQQMSPGNFTVTQTKCSNREFKEYFLWALSRNVMRNIVASYNESKIIGDEDVVTARLAKDLEVLNLHRTPLNCITLLKVSEFDFDESPVNRCDIIRRVLFLLFNVDSLPSYKTRPDLKDCEFVLGYFCEGLIRENKFLFARDKFLIEIQDFCKDNLIDLETHSVFDILFQNNIIVRVGHLFRFRFAYWVYYFAAQRMHHDQNFAKFILDDMRYSLYPEIIEFYTGIDRRREDALAVLTNDLKKLHEQVNSHLGLPDDINPYKFAIWKPSEAVVTQMEEELANGVKESNLPTVIKDQYADKTYDKQRPYNQEINKVLHDHTFVYMLNAMSASARALRNSDYATATTKKNLMQEILNCWSQATKILFVLLPLLAKNGYASYDGMGFTLGDGFGEDESERFMKILTCIPGNVATWTRDDIYSRKMGPLLIDQVNRKDIGEIERHELMLTLILTRPRDWEKAVQRYIASCSRNSFYLMDVNQALRHQYRVGYISDKSTLSSLEFLIKMSITKHLTGEKQPTQKSFKKIKGDVLPERLTRSDE